MKPLVPKGTERDIWVDLHLHSFVQLQNHAADTCSDHAEA